MKAQDIMTKDVVTVKEDMLLTKLCEKFSKSDYSGFPVVDRDKKVVGMVAERDVCQYLHGSSSFDSPSTGDVAEALMHFSPPAFFETLFNKSNDMTVGSIMTKNVAVAKQDASIETLAKLMHEKDVNRIPIVDDDNKLVGIVGRADIIKALGK